MTRPLSKRRGWPSEARKIHLHSCYSWSCHLSTDGVSYEAFSRLEEQAPDTLCVHCVQRKNGEPRRKRKDVGSKRLPEGSARTWHVRLPERLREAVERAAEGYKCSPGKVVEGAVERLMVDLALARLKDLPSLFRK